MDNFNSKRRHVGESASRTSVSTCAESPLTVEKTKQMMEKVSNKIQAIENKDGPMTTLKTYIVDVISKMLHTDKEHKRKTAIGIFGKSGDGKSSLLNAILGEEDLLPLGSSGACTALVTQVEANLTDSNYTADIELFTKEEWDSMLNDLLRTLSDKSDDRDDEVFNAAQEKITALYGPDAYQKTLKELKVDTKFAEISNFLSTNHKTISNSDSITFANEVASYIQHEPTGGWYWPLVKNVIKIKVPNHPELLEHIVLFDIPGTGDCSRTRDDLWKSKLSECSAVWIVSDINRAVADKDPWGILKHCIEELGPGGECKNINFICTKADVINTKAYMRAARLTEKDVLERNKDLTTGCVLDRNKSTKESLRRKLQNLNPGAKKVMEKFHTDVLTVSSDAYFKQKTKLEPTDTEIPKLQEVLKSINRTMKEEQTRDYINEARGVLSLIQVFSPNTSKETDEIKARIEELKNTLENVLTELDCQFTILYENLEKCLSEGVERSLKLCVETAKDEVIESEPDNRGFHKILRALCVRKGYYQSRNWSDHPMDLNDCLAKHMKESVEDEFNAIFPVNGTTEKSLQEKLDKVTITASDNTYCRSSMLYHVQNYIETRENALKASLKRKMIDRKKEMYSSIKTTIEKKMEAGYNRAKNVKGKGSFKKMQRILIDTIEAVKDDMFNEAKTEFLERFNSLKHTIKDAFEFELKRSMEPFLANTGNTTLLDVSREIEELSKQAP